MTRYDQTWKTLVERAIKQSITDLETFMAMARNAGISKETVIEKLIYDLENEGPIFGKFVRSITGASQATISAAFNAGSHIADIGNDPELRKTLAAAGYTPEDLGYAIDDADPESIAEIEDVVDSNDWRTWIATLVKTCDECLPLHGHTATMAEWKDRGLLPELMHDGWESNCKCRLVPAQQFDTEAKRRVDYVKPLVRTKLVTETGLKTSKKTQRTVMQADLDRALAARDKARDSDLGRRTLRLMGQMGEKGKG